MDEKAASILNRLVDLIPLILGLSVGVVAAVDEGARSVLAPIATALIGWWLPSPRNLRRDL